MVPIMMQSQLDDLCLNNNQPKQDQLHTQLVEWICTGRLQPGTQLPATRRLAEDLGVSRNTILEVIHRLRSEGFIQSHIGRGTFISNELPPDLTQQKRVHWPEKSDLPKLSEYGQALNLTQANPFTAPLPFSPGIPAVDQFPLTIWHRIVRRHQDRRQLLAYGDPQGYEPLRTALSQYLNTSRGVQCDADQIIITNGAQQAISLCSTLLLNHGDKVLIENPGYIGARKAFRSRNAELIPIPLKDSVVDVDTLLNNRSLPANAKLMYITPTHQYPVGGILSAAKRLKLLEWATHNNLWLIEDDYDSEYHFLHKPIAALQGMAAQTNVIYMGSFSKTLFPSLRIGYLVVPKPLAATFTTAKTFMIGESPLLQQAVVADFLAEGHFVRHLRRMRQLYKTKWQHFEGLIRTQLCDQVTVIAESAGMHLAIEIPGIDEHALRTALQKQGFGCTPLSNYYINSENKTGLVLGFANSSEEDRITFVAWLKTELIRFKVET